MQKTNFKTRLLALLTAVFMVVMCMPFAALADAPDVVVDLDWDKDQVEVTDWGSFRDVDGYVSATVKPGGEVVMPTVKGINGYKFKGWTNVGNQDQADPCRCHPLPGSWQEYPAAQSYCREGSRCG